jgi:putative toxin-antitoxin system antitoxin component (TIGR02293 family)
LKKIAPAALYRATGIERVQMIRDGVPATVLEEIVRKMDIPKERLYTTLRLPRSTVDRKIRNNGTLSAEHSERVIGLERLIGQVEVMVAQSGNPQGFEAERWVGEWLDRPLPALGGAKPADFMDTMEGQDLVSRLLAQSQSGAYA